jgi:hypothetical protein
MLAMTDKRTQAITGLVPPQLDEAVIRVIWPSVTAFPTVASLGSFLMQTRLLAPLGWLLLAPFYFIKVAPGFARRYVLTNRRIMFQKGLRLQAVDSVDLADIEEVRIQEDKNSRFYGSGDLEIISKGQARLRLRGITGPQAFRHAILNACMAWVPGKAAAMERFISAAASKPA